MSDVDVMCKLVPAFDNKENDPKRVVGVIRNLLGLGVGDTCQITIEGLSKGGMCFHGQKPGASFSWSIQEDGQTYLKAWGMMGNEELWDFLRKK